MPAQDSDQILLRLEHVEKTLQGVSARLYNLEQTVLRPRSTPTPQPTRTVEPPPQVFLSPVLAPPQNYKTVAWRDAGTAPPVKKAPSNQVDDLEYKIGLTGLLRGGAVVIVISLIFLAALVISRGSISPQAQFCGELILCATFIAVGFIKRNEREEFGQVMTGIGSCGLYLSFAGGHLFKHLYEGETLVALFVALSLANLTFSWWRSSRSFLAIGMIGGLTAAMMPMHRYNPTLDCALHFLILVPTAVIVTKNRWNDMSVILWIASTCALIPALTFDSVWVIRIEALYGTSLICASCYAATCREGEEETNSTLTATIVGLAGVLALLFDGVRHGSAHILVLSSAGALVGMAFSTNQRVRNAFWMGSLTAAVTLAPTGLNRLDAGLTYAILAILLAAASVKIAPRGLTCLSGVVLAFSLFAYTAPWISDPKPFTLAAETVLISLIMIATGICGYARWRAGGTSEWMALASASLMFPLFSRFGFILLTAPGVHLDKILALQLTLMVFAIAALAVGGAGKWTSTVRLGWVALFCALVAYMDFESDTVAPISVETPLLLALIGIVLYAGSCSRRLTDDDKQTSLIACSGALSAVLLVRLVVVWLTMSSLHLSRVSAFEIGIMASVLVSALLSIRFRWVGLVPQGWIGVVIVVYNLLLPSDGGKRILSGELVLIAVAIFEVLLMAYATTLFSKEKGKLAGLGAGISWTLVSKFGSLILTSKYVGLKQDPALTATWIVYAVALITLGFRYQVRSLRYWSLAIFGMTLIKVFLYDLADLDPAVRVGILMSLGLGMVGAGYWYVHSRPTTLREPLNEHMTPEPDA